MSTKQLTDWESIADRLRSAKLPTSVAQSFDALTLLQNEINSLCEVLDLVRAREVELRVMLDATKKMDGFVSDELARKRGALYDLESARDRDR